MEDEDGYMALDRRCKRGAVERPGPLRDAAPAACPQWHGVLLKLSGLSHVVLLVLLAVLSVQVFQKAPTPPSAPQSKSEAGGRSRMEACLIPSLLRYVCRWNGSAGHGGCKLCPQSWQLSGDQCYQVPKSSGTWMQGKKDCESRGSHLAMLRNTADMEHLNEGIQQGSKEKLSVWIGLKASNNTWKWVDNSSFDATTFSSLRNVENGCATFKDKRLEDDCCGCNHKWVCQKEPFHLLSKTAGDGELCGARPEKPSLQDACC
ncbi:killer cell lectin-like receptor subfamily B member 1C isoform X2 [Cygnus olor]|uniref:killer cell lectin-like receptor subfamily B member 1C isoform X2 n=1 Tax=Cygnus olor TaxID=8869 RepID=UPI001ADE73CF|nr:killer cell lectin-like receptor subfamily B member 1C isoform X2 [Cygnus olor]